MTTLAGIIQQLKQERERLSRQLQGISVALSAFGTAYGKVQKRTPNGRLSAAARARISTAQKARWAKVRQRKTTATMNDSEDLIKKATAPKKRTKRTMSAATRKRLAAIAKARWAKAKAQKRTSL